MLLSPTVTWTLKQAWDPSIMDNELSTDTDWSGSNLSVERTTLSLPSTEPKFTDPNLDDQTRLHLYISTGGILDCNWNGPIAPFIADWRDKLNRYIDLTNKDYDESTLSSFLDASTMIVSRPQTSLMRLGAMLHQPVCEETSSVRWMRKMEVPTSK